MSPGADREVPAAADQPRMRHSIWRQRRPVGAHAERSLMLRRGLLLLLLAALALCFYIVLVSPYDHPRLRIATLSTVGPSERNDDGRPWAGAPFVAQDLAAWKDLAAGLAPETDEAALLEIPVPNVASDLEALGERLDESEIGPRDVLLLYVRSEGVVRQGEPHLLCDAGGSGGSSYALSRLLRQLRDRPYAAKLIVLDAGLTRSSPQDGILIDEFSRLVAEQVNETGDSGLWVLLSHGLMESSQVLWSRERSVLTESLTAGLAGAADRNGDREISIDELHRYASNSVKQITVQLSDGQANQSPQLYWGRGETPTGFVSPILAPVAPRFGLPTGEEPTATEGTAAAPASRVPANPFSSAVVSPPAATVSASPAGLNLSLTRPTAPALPTSSSLTTNIPAVLASAANSSTSAPAATAAAPPATAAGPAPVQPAAAAPAPAINADSAAPPAAATSDAPSAADDPAAASPMEGIAGLLMQAWQLRDQFEERSRLPVSPVDVAPLDWRLLVDDLRQLELQYRDGSITEPDAVAAELRGIIDTMTGLMEGQSHAPLPRERASLWLALDESASLPAVTVTSVAMAMALAEHAGTPVPDALTSAWPTFVASLDAEERTAFDTSLQSLPPEQSNYIEFVVARRLAAITDLEWRLLSLAVQTRCRGEQAAAQWEAAPMVREPAAYGDELLLAAEQLLIDGVDPYRMPRATALLQQANSHFETAIANGELLVRARRLRRDLSYQAPDYVAWWADTGLAMYRCGPTSSDVAALLAELQELGALLQSGRPEDRDGIFIQAGLLEGIADRISAAGCASRTTERRPDLSRETPWHMQTILATSLPRAAHRLQLLQEITQIEEERLAAVPAHVPDAPIPAPTLSLRDWKFLEAHAAFQRELARLAAADLPGGAALLEPLEAEFRAVEADHVARTGTQFESESERISHYRQLEAALARFYDALPDAVESANESLLLAPQVTGTGEHLAALEAVLQAQRFIIGEGGLSAVRGEWLRRQAAELLAWEAQRLELAVTNADAARSRYFSDAARRLLAQSGQLAGVVRNPVTPIRPLQVDTPVELSLIDSEQDVDVGVSLTTRSATDVWLVLEYDPQLIAVSAPAGMPIYHEPQLAAEFRTGPTGASASQSTTTRASESRSGPPLPSADASFTGTWWTPWLRDRVPPSATLGNRGPLTFTLHVERLTPAARPTRLVVKALSAEHFARGLVEFRTPRPPFADLLFSGSDGTVEPVEGGQSLHPFPNRETEYRFRLLNLTDSARIVNVTLLALSEPLNFDLPVGTLTTDEAALVMARLPASTPAARFEKRTLPPAGAPAVPAAAEPEEPPPAPGAEKPLPSLLYGGVAVIADDATGDTVFVRVNVEPQRPVRYLRPEVGYSLQRERVEITVRGESAEVMPPGGSTVRAEFVEPLDVTATFLLDGVIQAPGFSTQLYADVASAPGKVVHLRLHVDGYPRAFLYAIPCDRASAVPATTDALAIAVEQPAAGTAYQTPLGGVPVALQLDVPLGAFRTLTTIAEVGLDVNRDRYLLNEPALRLNSDRQIDVRLKTFKPDGSFVLKTAVSDFQVTIPAAGLGTARVNVLGRVQVDAALAWSEPREIILDGDAPRIDTVELSPGRVLSSEDKLQAAVFVDDRTESGTARVELTFDLSRSGEFAPDANVIPAAETIGSVWRAELPLADLPPGTHGLLIRAVDRTGNVSRTHRELVTVLSAEELAARTLAATSPVRGVALFGEMPVAGASVTLTNDKQEVVGTASANGSGEFEFPPAPAGKYTVSAEGLVRNKFRTASAEVTVPDPPAPTERVQLQLR